MEFESALQEHMAVSYCVTCASSSVLLREALVCFDIKADDAVLYPDYDGDEYVKIINDLGAHPVPVSVCDDTFLLNPNSLEKCINELKSSGSYVPKALICADTYGQAADYYNIRRLCRNANIKLLEDARCACGGGVDVTGFGDYKMSGSYGDIGIAAFDDGLPLSGQSGGGAFFTEDKDIATKLRAAVSPMTDDQSKQLRDSLARFRGEASVRRQVPEGSLLLARAQVSEWYDTLLKPLEKKGLLLPVVLKDNLSVWPVYPVRCNGRVICLPVDAYMTREDVEVHVNSLSETL